MARASLLYILLALSSYVTALHFYLDASERRCFIEELPTDTVVEGELVIEILLYVELSLRSGHYRALEWKERQQEYTENPVLGIQVDVEVRQ